MSQTFLRRTPETEALQQEQAATSVMDQQAAEQDFIVKQQKEAAKAQQAAEEAAHEAARAQKAQIAAAKNAGVKIQTDAATGQDTMARHEDGAPLYESGFTSEPQQGQNGPAVSYRDPRGKQYDVPVSAINRTTDPTGSPFYEFTLPTGERVRQPEDKAKPLFKVDPNTGQRYTEAPDTKTGSFTQTPLGLDREAAAKAAIEKRKAAAKQQEDERSFKASELRLMQDQQQIALRPVKDRLDLAADAFDKLEKSKTRYEKRPEGIVSIQKFGEEEIASPIDTTDASRLSAAQAWIEQYNRTKQELEAAKAAHDPLATEIQKMDEQRAKLALDTLHANRRDALELDAMERAAKAGAPVHEPAWQKRLSDALKDPRIVDTFTKARLADEGSPLADDVERVSLPETGKLIGKLLDLRADKGLQPGQGVLQPGTAAQALARPQPTLKDTILESLAADNLPATGKDAQALATESLGITDPEKWSVTTNEQGTHDLSRDGQLVGTVDTRNNQIRLFPPTSWEQENEQVRITQANQNGLPIYYMGGGQPMRPQELRDYIQSGFDISGTTKDPVELETKLAAAGLSPDAIRRNVLDGRLSVQDGRMLAEKFHGITQTDTTQEGTRKAFGEWLTKPENRTQAAMFAKGDAGQKADVVNGFFDQHASQATNNLLPNRSGLATQREAMLKPYTEKGLLGKAGGFVKELIMPMIGIGAQGAALPFQEAMHLFGAETEAGALSNEEFSNWLKRSSGFLHRIGTRNELDRPLGDLEAWMNKANPGDEVPQELADRIAAAAFDTYHQLTEDGAKDLNTTRDTFDVNKDPALRGIVQNYLQTANPSARASLLGMLTMDAKDRETQQKVMAYIEAPRTATAGEAQERAALAGVTLTPEKAGQVLAIGQQIEKADTPAKVQNLVKQAGGIMGLSNPADIKTALDLITRKTSTSPDSAWGLTKGGFVAGRQELATEALTTAAEAGVGFLTAGAATPEIIAERAARQGIVSGARAALRRTLTAGLDALSNESKLFAAARGKLGQARRAVGGAITKEADAFAKAGIVQPKFGAPLTTGQKARNIAVAGVKAGAAAAPMEGLEEGVAAIGETDPNLDSLVQQIGMGAAGGMVLGPLFTGGGVAAQAWKNRGLEARMGELKTKWAEDFNRNMAGVAGFKPMRPEDFDVAMGVMNTPEHAAARESFVGALAELQAAAQEQADIEQVAAGNATMPKSPRLMAAEARAQKAGNDLAAASTFAFEAADELRQLPADQQPLYTGIAKAISGAREFTEPEAKALIGLQGDNAVAFQQAMPADVAGPPSSTKNAPAVTETGPGRYTLPEGVTIAVPPQALAMLGERAPSLVGALARSQSVATTPTPAPNENAPTHKPKSARKTGNATNPPQDATAGQGGDGANAPVETELTTGAQGKDTEPTIVVPWQRVDSGVFGSTAGDIASAMTGGMPEKNKIAKTFTHEGRVFAAIGGGGNYLGYDVSGYELIPADQYKGPTEKVKYSHEGEIVTHKGKTYRLGPKTEFKSSEKTVDEWRDYLRRQYQHGGHFTSGKTYHEFVGGQLNHEVWNPAQKQHVPVAQANPNMAEAVRLELAEPNFDKWKGEKPADSTKKDAQPKPAAQSGQLTPKAHENIARGVIGAVSAKSPKLKKLIKESQKASKMASGGMWTGYDGTIVFHMPSLVKQLAGLDAQTAAKRVEAILDEEIRHSANLEAARRLYKRGGTNPLNLPFEQWREAWYGDIWENHFTEEMRQQVIEAYGPALSKVPWERAMEGLRMLDQLRATDSITEAVLRHLEAVLQALREFLAAATPKIKAEIQAIQAILIEFGYEQGAVKPEKAQKQPAKPRKKSVESAQTPEKERENTSQAIPPVTTQATNEKEQTKAQGQKQEVLNPVPEAAPRESELSNPDMGSAGAVDGDAGDQALADAFSGLYSSPARLTQADLPKERRDAMMKAASVLVDVGVKTPLELAQRLEKLAPNGALRQYSRAFWRLMTGFDSSLEESPDWQAVYAELDQDSSRPPSAEGVTGPSSEQGAAPANSATYTPAQQEADRVRRIESEQRVLEASAKADQAQQRREELLPRLGTGWQLSGNTISKNGFGHWTEQERDEVRQRFREAGIRSNVSAPDGNSTRKSSFTIQTLDASKLAEEIFAAEQTIRESERQQKIADEEKKTTQELAQIDSVALQWMTSLFQREDFANAYNKVRLSEFVTGKTAKFTGMVNPRWLGGAQAANAVLEGGKVDFAALKQHFEKFKAANSSSPAKAEVPERGDTVTWTDGAGKEAVSMIDQITNNADGTPVAWVEWFGVKSIPLDQLTLKTKSSQRLNRERREAEAAAKAGIPTKEVTTPEPVKEKKPADTKALKEMKRFLLEKLDDAIAEAPDFDSGDNISAQMTALEGHREFLRQLLRNAEAYTPVGIAKIKDRLGALIQLPEKAGFSEYDKALGELINQEAARIRALRPKVIIEIPGDGTFTLINDKKTLKEFAKIAKGFPTSTPSATYPKPTAIRPSGIPSLNKAKLSKMDIVKVAGTFASTDETRMNIMQVVDVGDTLVATNGKYLFMAPFEGQGTAEDPMLYTAKGGQIGPQSKHEEDFGAFPANWRQVVPADTQVLHTGIDTGRLWQILKQASAVFRDVNFQVKNGSGTFDDAVPYVDLFLNPDGSVAVVGEVENGKVGRKDNVDRYEHNLQEGAQSIGRFNADLFMDILAAMRALGQEKVSLRSEADMNQGALVVSSPVADVILMRVRTQAATNAANVEAAQAAMTPAEETAAAPVEWPTESRNLTLADTARAAEMTEAEIEAAATPVLEALRELEAPSGLDQAGIAKRGGSVYDEILEGKFSIKELAAAHVWLRRHNAYSVLMDSMEYAIARDSSNDAPAAPKASGLRAQADTIHAGRSPAELLALAAPYEQQGPDYNRNIAESAARLRQSVERGTGSAQLDADELAVRLEKWAPEASLNRIEQVDMRRFSSDLNDTGVAYVNGDRYAIKQANDGTYYVERTRNGQREDLATGFADIAAANRGALEIVSGAPEAQQAKQGDRGLYADVSRYFALLNADTKRRSALEAIRDGTLTQEQADYLIAVIDGVAKRGGTARSLAPGLIERINAFMEAELVATTAVSTPAKNADDVRDVVQEFRDGITQDDNAMSATFKTVEGFTSFQTVTRSTTESQLNDRLEVVYSKLGRSNDITEQASLFVDEWRKWKTPSAKVQPTVTQPEPETAAEVVTTPPAEEQPAPQVPPAKRAKKSAAKIEDFGEKIGGARKDTWKERGLGVADFDNLSDTEKQAYTVKPQVFPKPDYQAWIDGGIPRELAWALKEVYDAITPKPNLTRAQQADPVQRDAALRLYVEFVSKIRDALPNITNLDELRALKDTLLPRDSRGMTQPEARAALELASKTRGYRYTLGGKMTPSSYDLYQYKRELEQNTAWPASQEAWQRMFSIRKVPVGTVTSTRLPDGTYERKEVTAETPDNWQVIKSDGRWNVIVSDGHATREEAEAVAKRLAESKKGDKGGPLKRPLNPDARRVGPDYRNGRDVTGQDLLDTFGFRGGEFGNWTNEADRQQSLNQAYDGLLDLARVLNLPPKALSLNGELGIAFGARGSGKASAHYEPAKVVINLTRTSGAGALAHEWAHAVDDYFGRMVTKGQIGKYVSHGAKGTADFRAELAEAINAVMKAIDSRQTTAPEYIESLKTRNAEAKKALESWLKSVERVTAKLQLSQDSKNAVLELQEMLLGNKLPQIEEGGRPNMTAVANEMLTIYALQAKAQKEHISWPVTGGGKMSDLASGLGRHAGAIHFTNSELAKAEAGTIEIPTRMVETTFLKESKEQGDYWQRRHELFARAFEAFVEDSIRLEGNASPYLVQSTFDSGAWGSLYPQGDERTATNEALRKMAATFKTRDTEKGVALFSAPRYQSPAGLAETARQARGESSAATPQGLSKLFSPSTSSQAPAVAERGVEKYFSNTPLSTIVERAYRGVQRASSTRFVPIRAVFMVAKAAHPEITPDAFMAEIRAADERGDIMLEAPERPETIQQAGPFVVRNALGVPSTNMMVMQPEGQEVLAMPSGRATRGALASDSGAAQSNEPSPGGLSEAELRREAIRKGFTIKAFGGHTDGIAQFVESNLKVREGIWFTDVRAMAQSYAEWSVEREDGTPDGVASGTVYDVFLKIKNPLFFDMQGGTPSEIAELDERYRDLDDLVSDAFANGHDGVVVQNVRDYAEDGYGDKAGSVFIVKNGHQIKSADRLTRDETGQIIPPEFRFDGGPDIRGDINWKQKSQTSQAAALNDRKGQGPADAMSKSGSQQTPPSSVSVNPESSRAAGGTPVNPKLVEAARGVARTEDPSSNLRLLFSTEQRLNNAEPSLEVRQHDAVTVPAALDMIARGGDPQLIAAIWRQHRNDVSQKKTTAPNPFTPSELMRDAYDVQARKSSTKMVPLQQVFDQMRKAEPALTPPQFLERVHEAYNAGSVLLEGAGSTQEQQSHEPFVVPSMSGPGIRMAWTNDEGLASAPALSQRFNSTQDSILRSAPAPDAAKAKAIKEAIATMPPMWQEALNLSMKGTAPEDIATRMNLSETAVGNILRTAQGRLRILLEASEGKLKPTVRVEDEKVKAATGRPDYAMSGNATFAAVDQRRSTPEEVTHGEMEELAQRLFATDPVAAEKLVVRWMDSGTTVLSTDGMPEAIKAIVADAQARSAAEMLMTAAAKLLVTDKSLAGGDTIQLARLIDLYRNTGTEQARALNMRYDPQSTPEERAAMYLSEALLTPPEAMRNEIRRNPANKEKILAAWAAEAEKLKEQLKAEGYDIDATFRELAKEKKLAESAIPQEVKIPLAKASGKTRALVKAVLEGKSWGEAAAAAKMTLEKARKAYMEFRDSINKAGVQAAQEAKEALLRSAPAADFAAQLGLPEWLENASPDYVPVRTQATEELKKQRERKKAPAEIDLKDPVSVSKTMRNIATAKSGVFDKISEYWRASILSGPQTHVVNFVSGATFGLYESTFKKLSSAVQGDIARMFGMKPDAASLADIPSMLAAVLPSIKRAFTDSIRAWQTESRSFDAYAQGQLDALSENGRIKGDIYTPALRGIVGKVMRGISFRLMGAADEFVKSFFTRVEVAAQARQIARNEGKTGDAFRQAVSELMEPGSLAWLRALEQSKKITFQTEIGSKQGAIDKLDALAKLINDMKKGRYGGGLKGLAHFIFPFVDTPTNIFKTGVTMSPVGGLLAIIDGVRALNLMRKGNKEQAAAIYNAARAFDDMTNQIVAWGFILALSELVRPGDDDEELPWITGTLPWRTTAPGEREIAYRVAPPQSIRIGDQWVSYKRLDPFASALAFTVDAIKEFTSGRPVDETWGNVGLNMLRNMQDKTFLQGVSDLFNAINDPERFGTKWAVNIATGFIPNLIRQPIRTADPLIRESDIPNDMGFWSSLGRRVGYSVNPQGQMPAIDVWGREQAKNTGTGSPQTDWMLRLFSPADTKDAAGVDYLDVALLRYNMAHDKPFGITAPSREIQKTINGKPLRVSLNDAEYDEMTRKAGHAARTAIGDRFKGRDLTENDVELIKDIISRAQGVYRDAAFARAFQKRGLAATRK